MDQWTDLPLFLLNTVLFPGMVLPLHVFEERYKLMINRCVEEELPFGVVLIREGLEVGENAVPYEVGTAAHIANVSRLDEGRMNIVVVGSERFRLHTVRYDRPYLLGSVEFWPLANAVTERGRARVEPLRALFRQYLNQLAQAQGHRIDIEEIPAEPRTLALLIAIALQLPMPQKQRLLDQPSVASMLQAEWTIIRREQLILNHMIHTQTDQWEGGYSGYLAKN